VPGEGPQGEARRGGGRELLAQGGAECFVFFFFFFFGFSSEASEASCCCSCCFCCCFPTAPPWLLRNKRQRLCSCSCSSGPGSDPRRPPLGAAPSSAFDVRAERGARGAPLGAASGLQPFRLNPLNLNIACIHIKKGDPALQYNNLPSPVI